MATEMKLDPAPIMQISTGPWANAILAAAVEHRAFARLESAPAFGGSARGTGAHRPRGAQALLDGLLGLGLVEKEGDRYRNTALASQFLVEDKPLFLGGLSRVNLAEGRAARFSLSPCGRVPRPSTKRRIRRKTRSGSSSFRRSRASPLRWRGWRPTSSVSRRRERFRCSTSAAGRESMRWSGERPTRSAASRSSTGPTSTASRAASRGRLASPTASRRSTTTSHGRLRLRALQLRDLLEHRPSGVAP